MHPTEKHDSKVIDFLSKLKSSTLSKIIFGEPVTKEDVTVIPLAKIRYGFGYGFGSSKSKTDGQGAGGGGIATPIGYIEIQNNKTQFKPIRTPTSLLSIVAMTAVSGLLLLKIVQNIKK